MMRFPFWNTFESGVYARKPRTSASPHSTLSETSIGIQNA